MSNGYQFTPFGMFPLGAPVPDAGDAVVGATARVETPEPVRQIQATKPAASSFDPGKPLTGKQLVAVARARIKELDKILRAVPALQEERSSLASLILAATPPRKRKGVQ